MTVNSYQDLKIWQEGMNLAVMCYQLTQTFPKEEIFGLTSQIRRASSSIPANIAEGYGRETTPEYTRFLRIAQGSLKELETHLILAIRIQLTAETEMRSVIKHCEQLGKMIRSLIRTSEKKGDR